MTDLDADVADRVSLLLKELRSGDLDATAFLGRQFDLGLAWVHHGEGEGGCGRPPEQQRGVDALLGAEQAPRQPFEAIIGLGMAAPTIAKHGSGEQRQEFLRRTFTAELIWCQLFSEPGAGSDLAGLATSATPVSGGWRVNGQKVWTTFAHLADFGLLLARTDPDAVKHRGLTLFVLDMRSAGVDVRPLYQITGEAEFNEVFLSDVFVPDAMRVGEVGGGWNVAMTTLMNERASIAGEMPAEADELMREVMSLWRDRGCSDPVDADRLVSLWIRTRLLEQTVWRAHEAGERGVPGPEGSIGKLCWAELRQDIASMALDVMGDDALLHPLGYPMKRPEPRAQTSFDPRYAYLRSLANSIEGGTSEIMRSIIGERVLGLAPEPRVDKAMPWRETRRS